LHGTRGKKRKLQWESPDREKKWTEVAYKGIGLTVPRTICFRLVDHFQRGGTKSETKNRKGKDSKLNRRGGRSLDSIEEWEKRGNLKVRNKYYNAGLLKWRNS